MAKIWHIMHFCLLLGERNVLQTLIDRKPNVRILQNNVTLESERYTTEFLYIERLNMAYQETTV